MVEGQKKGWWLIVNPMAGGARLGQVWQKMALALQNAGLIFEFRTTESRNHAVKLVEDGIKLGYSQIAGVGGDGTNNEIINGILTQKVIPIESIKYTLLPFGTGNDWSRTHRIPHKIFKWVAMVQNDQCISHSIGKVSLSQKDQTSHRFFINIVGLAFDARIVKLAESYKNRSRRKWLYFWLLISNIWKYNSPKLKIRTNDLLEVKKVYAINCGICNYAGGGMKIVPQADATKNFLGLTIIEDFPKWRVPFDSPKLFNGSLVNHKYTSLQKCTHVHIESSQQNAGIEVEADGEYLGIGRVRIELDNRRLWVVVG